MPEIDAKDIFISTGNGYRDIVAKQLPFLPQQNIIGEPEKKDVGPAVAYAVSYIKKITGSDEPVIILWSDHMVRQEDRFKQLLQAAEALLSKEPNKIVFIGQKPRFASDNLGWIHYGGAVTALKGVALYSFEGFQYRPKKDVAQKYFESGTYCWNLGYFVIRPSYLESLFKQHVPEIASHTEAICDAIGTPRFDEILNEHYGQMPSINFDNALLEKLDKDDAYVIVEDIGWSDVGAWEALKEALQKKQEDNVTNGQVLLRDSEDNLIYNYSPTQLVVGIDLEDLLVVNTGDVLLITQKKSVGKIKTLVESFQDTEYEHLT
jgi:mannose-1-phosphate guanylyltransferase